MKKKSSLKKPIYSTWEATKEQACGRFDEAKIITIEATFQQYKPSTKGKGSGVQYWNYRVLFDDGIDIPAERDNYDIEMDLIKFVDKRVRIKARVFYGVLVGDPDDFESQQMTGYRIDVREILSI